MSSKARGPFKVVLHTLEDLFNFREILCRLVRLPGPASDLIRQHGLLQWVSAQLPQLNKSQQHRELHLLVQLVETCLASLSEESKEKVGTHLGSVLESLGRATRGDPTMATRIVRMSMAVKQVK